MYVGTYSTASTWSSWNGYYVTTGASAGTGGDLTWYQWNSGTAAAITYETACATMTTTTEYTWVDWNGFYAERQRESEAERAARQLQIQADRERERVRSEQLRVEREEAERKAKELLLQNLDDEQRAEFEQSRQFTVISKGSQRRYQVRQGRVQNVYEVDAEGNSLRRLCAHPRENVPDADTMLAQKLMLEHCEDEFLRIANISRVA